MADPTIGGEHPQHLQMRSLPVLCNLEIASQVYSLQFPREFDFQPGQVVALALAPQGPVRFYSIASGAQEPNIEVLFDLVPGGELTPALSRMVPGDRLLVSEPFGSFVDRDGPSWWIATGTGIAPFLAMVRSGITQEKQLVHGGRTLDRFYYHDLIDERLGGRYRCCCSSERAPWVYPGRLTAWLAEAKELPSTAAYLLCGSAGMVVEVRDRLIERAIPFERILAEVYF